MASSQKTIQVLDLQVTVREVDTQSYICLTDMVRSHKNPSQVINNWLRTRGTLNFLGEWEKIYNPDFNLLNYEKIMRVAGDVNFTMSVKEWRAETLAVGIDSKAGRYGGTYAHQDIAFEFAMAISPRFKILLIKEFQRMKAEEARLQDQAWDANRFLVKRNYELHTETIKNFLLRSKEDQPDKQWLTYAEEADVLNVIIFGQSAREWKREHPEAVKKGLNQRDFATNEQLIVMSNLEALNTELIRDRLPKEERYYKLRDAATYQLGLLYRMRLKSEKAINQGLLPDSTDG